jgi:hypothetical protein
MLAKIPLRFAGLFVRSCDEGGESPALEGLSA